MRNDGIVGFSIVGFSFIILIFIFLGVFSIFGIRSMAVLTSTIYNHPLKVSKAALSAQIATATMHKNLQDALMAQNTSSLFKTLDKVAQNEKQVLSYLDIVKDNILGVEGRSLENKTREIFLAWRPIREEVIQLSKAGHIQDAMQRLHGKGARHDVLLEEQMLSLTSYAQHKADSFLLQSLQDQKKFSFVLIIVVSTGAILSFVIAFLTTKKVLSSFRSIREAEKKLQESEERFRRVFETSRDGLLLANKHTGIITHVNGALVKMLGVEKEELLGKKIQDAELISKDYDLANLMDTLEKSGLLAFDSILINARTFQPFHVEMTFVNKSLNLQCNIRDITTRIVEKDLLSQAVREWEATFDTVPDLVAILDKEMRILRANEAFNNFFSINAGEFNGRHCYEIFAAMSAPCSSCPVQKTRLTHQAESYTVHHKHLGKTFHVQITPMHGENQEIISYVHVAHDITELKKVENQLRQAQKMEAIGTLAGGIAHDFNNILTAILGYGELARESVPADSPISDDLNEILKASKRATELVRQILTFSRQSEQDPKPLKVQFIIKESLKMLRSSIPTTIDIRQNIDLECDTVLADPTQIHQVIMNLCTNAFHAMRRSGGTLSISLSQAELGLEDMTSKLDFKPGAYVILEVGDTGCGIEAAMLEKIFEPYYTTKEKGEGTGLGLSVVHGIVKRLNGHINVYSELGEGSTFRVYLPVYEAGNYVATENTSAAPPLPRGTERILVVDDEESIVHYEKKILEGLGYQVATIIDSEEALKVLTEQPHNFDLLITDMTMPKVIGTDLAQQVLKVRADMPIILCTGYSEQISEEKAKEMGIRAFIMKPISKNTLAETIRRTLDG